MLNLKKLRAEKGISQQALAEQFNLSQQSIYKYEHELAEPDISTLKKFAEYFDVSIDYLVGYSDPYKEEWAASGDPPFSRHEIEMIRSIRNLRPEIRASLQLIIERLSDT